MLESRSRIAHFWKRCKRLGERWRFAKNLSIGLFFFTLIAVITTFIVMTDTDGVVPDPNTVLSLILLDLILVIALIILISRRVTRLWLERRKGKEGSRLQRRIISGYSLVAAIPAIIVAVFSAVFFNFGIQLWFDERVQKALEESVNVAHAYLEEHRQMIRADILLTAHDIDRKAFELAHNPTLFNKQLAFQADIRSLTEAIVFQGDKILGAAALSSAITFKDIPPEAIAKANRGEVALIGQRQHDAVRAIVKLENFLDAYLLVGRFIDHRVIEHIDSTEGAEQEYKRLRGQISSLEIKFFLIFFMLAVLLVLASIWRGMVFAGQITHPISRLVKATHRIKDGDYAIRVDEKGPENDEVVILSRAFNSMMRQLGSQHEELIQANKEIDAKRHFNEAVLEGVSSGIIVLDQNLMITMVNRSAKQLIASRFAQSEGKSITDVFLEIKELLNEVVEHPSVPAQKEIILEEEKARYIFLVRIVAEQLGKMTEGYIITFEDITDFVVAQRRAAWADVARRIAHEIKNPLTPIHLASERLRKKYINEVSDKESLEKYVDTITRHVSSISSMVEEFVQFARMPAPQFAEHDIIDIVREAIFTEEQVAHDIKISLECRKNQLKVEFDENVMTQVLINLLKNAIGSIRNRFEALSSEKMSGKIEVTVAVIDQYCMISVKDNGSGFPQAIINHATEPYVTTHKKGTGLGLAIVKKAIEDHNGQLIISNNEDQGATVIVQWPMKHQKL